jgi:hypothetical protein
MRTAKYPNRPAQATANPQFQTASGQRTGMAQDQQCAALMQQLANNGNDY